MGSRLASGPSRGSVASASARAAELRSGDSERLRRYAACLDFYDGRQWAKSRPGRTNLVVNYARIIVDKGVSYLLGRGVEFEAAGGEKSEGRRVKSEEEGGRGAQDPALGTQDPGLHSVHSPRSSVLLLRQVYEENDLEAVDAQGAINAAVLGDAIFKVFWQGIEGGGDGQTGRPGEGRIRVVNIDPFTFFPTWAADDPSTLLSVEVAYQMPAPPSPIPHTLVDVVERWTDLEFTLTVGDREVVRTANPYGFIPFVHIPNVRPANEFWGVSDLKDVIPLNRELNERMSDMADVIRFHSDPPVIFKGVREHSDLSVGPGTVWDLPEGAEVELLEWRGQTPTVHEHVERVMRALHDVAETPRTAFGDSGRLLSGIALETELQPLIQKTLRKRIWWGAGLRRRNRYILRIAELMGLGSFAPYRTRVVWPDLPGGGGPKG